MRFTYFLWERGGGGAVNFGSLFSFIIDIICVFSDDVDIFGWNSRWSSSFRVFECFCSLLGFMLDDYSFVVAFVVYLFNLDISLYILARSVSGTVVHLSWVVSLQWPFRFSSYLSYGSWFLYYLRYTRGLGVSSLRGYRSVFSAVFRFHLPSLSSDFVPLLPTLFSGACATSPYLGLVYGADLSSLTGLWALCLRLPSALSRWRHCFCWLLPLPKWVGELQALSSIVTFVAGDACLSYIPQFVAKSESLTRSIPRSFLVTSLADFEDGLDSDLLLCPVWALRLYLLRARSLSPGRHRLFVSPRRPARPFLRTRCHSFWGRS